MVETGASTDGRPGSTSLAQVVLIHPDEATDMVAELLNSWQRSMPRAEFTRFSTSLDVDAAGIRSLSSDLRKVSDNPHRTVFACLFGTEKLAFKLVLAEPRPVCRGLVACGLGLLPDMDFVPEAANRGMKLRLVWEADGPPASASMMSALFASLRSAKIDAQGTVLNLAGHLAAKRDRGPVPMSQPVERLAGSYLGELVAIALDPAFLA